MGVESRVMKDLYVGSRALVMWTTDTPSPSSKRARPSRPTGGRISAPPASHYSQGGFPNTSILQKGRDMLPIEYTHMLP